MQGKKKTTSVFVLFQTTFRPWLENLTTTTPEPSSLLLLSQSFVLNKVPPDFVFLHLVHLTRSTFQQLKKKEKKKKKEKVRIIFRPAVFVCKPVNCCCPTYSVAASFTESLQDSVIHRLKSSGAALGHRPHVWSRDSLLFIYASKRKKTLRGKTELDFESNILTHTIQEFPGFFFLLPKLSGRRRDFLETPPPDGVYFCTLWPIERAQECYFLSGLCN